MPQEEIRKLDPSRSFAEIFGAEDALPSDDTGDEEKQDAVAQGPAKVESESRMVRYLVEAINPGYEGMHIVVDNVRDTTGTRARGIGAPGGTVDPKETPKEAFMDQEIAEIPRWKVVKGPIQLLIYKRVKKDWQADKEGRRALFNEVTACFWIAVDVDQSGKKDVPESIRHIEKQEIGAAYWLKEDHIMNLWQEAKDLKTLGWLLRRARDGVRLSAWEWKKLDELSRRFFEARGKRVGGRKAIDLFLGEWGEKVPDPRKEDRRFFVSHGPLFEAMIKKTKELKASGEIVL